MYFDHTWMRFMWYIGLLYIAPAVVFAIGVRVLPDIPVLKLPRMLEVAMQFAFLAWILYVIRIWIFIQVVKADLEEYRKGRTQVPFDSYIN